MIKDRIQSTALEMAVKLTLEQQKELYTKAKSVYYSDPNGKQVLTDKQFDDLEEQIKAADPRWKGFKVGAPVNKKTKVPLPIPMFSLDKVKTEQAVENFLKTDSDIVVMDKLDGSSLELGYKNGVPVSLITRGNGKIGGNVSYMIPHLRGIPFKVGTKSFIVRCEGLFSKASFTKHKDEFDSPRNGASGILNRQDIHKAVKDLSIVCLSVLEPNLKTSQGLKWLKSVGFKVVAFKVFKPKDLNFELLTQMVGKRKSVGNYIVDGIVLTYDKKNPLPKSGNPDWSVAFKVDPLEHEIPITTVKAVHWNVSSHGYIIPRVEFDPIQVEGAKLSFATAFNAKFVVDNHINVGVKVSIIRSGEIIPKIVKVWSKKSIKPALPDPSVVGAYSWDKTHTNIVLDAPKENEQFRAKKIARCFGTLKIDFLKGGTVDRLIDAGYDNVTKILKATPEQFSEIEGFKPLSANKLWNAIHSKTDKGFPAPQLMDASGVFPRGVGQTRLEAVEKQYNLMSLAREAVDNKKSVIKKISSIQGFQQTTAEMIANGMPKFLKWLRITGLKIVAAEKVKTKSSKLSGISVSFTGFRDKDAEATITENGGLVVPFGGRTKVLLVSPNGKTSGKADIARSKGIDVLTWEQFQKKYGV